MKAMAIIWFVESVFGSPRKRPVWTLLMVFVGIAVSVLMLGLRFPP